MKSRRNEYLRIPLAAALFVLSGICLNSVAAAQQTSEWTWIGGSSTGNLGGVYGTQGTPAVGNSPGSREIAASWSDSSGHLWLFGGSGADANDAPGDLNDLWEFDESAQEWTWVGGSSTREMPGVYGTLGMAAPGNIPGARDGAAAWADSSGHLWLFGGAGYDANGNYAALSDLWEFDPVTKQWAWIGGSKTGSQPGVYGTLGTPAPGNTPGFHLFASTWTDKSDHLWLFGGIGIYSNGTGALLNDLWEFNPSTDQWAWMGGSNLEPACGYPPPLDRCGQPGVYGALGTAAAGNIPGSRYRAATWSDSSGHLWLFGGLGYAALNSSGYLNDVWEFNPSTDQWAWMGGSNSVPSCGNPAPPPPDYCGQPGVYGALGTSAAGNFPGGRSNAATWSDSSGDLWLFGGTGHDAQDIEGILNDVWEFKPSTGQWAWMDGSNLVPSCRDPYFCGQPGVYGTQGMAAAGNIPGGRVNESTWTDSSGRFWLFGGFGFDTNGGYLDDQNDLWTYQPSATNSSPAVSLSATSLSFGYVSPGGSSASQSVTLTNTGESPLSITGISITGADASFFDFTNNCGATVAPGANCTIHGHFAPTALGAMTAAVTLTYNADGSPQSILLSGIGGTPPAVALSATSLSFGSIGPRGSSASQSVTLTNTGGSPLTITSINVTGADAASFGFANNCGTTLVAGANCSIHGHFAPTTTGELTAAVAITDNATGSPQSIALSGTGLTPGAVSLSATSLSFGYVGLGGSSASQSVTLTNTGEFRLSITGIAVTGADASSFVFVSNCGATVAAGASCTVHGHFAPTTLGTLTAAITITDNGANSPQSVALSGIGGTPPEVALSATNLSFGSVATGASSATQSVTLTNTGGSSLSITSIAVVGADASSFDFSNNCGTTLVSGANCSIHGHFAPAATGPLTAAITITDNATGSPQGIALSGTGK